MSKRNPVGGGSSGASQPAAPSSKRPMRKRKAEVGNSSGAFQPDAPSSKQRHSAASLSIAPGGGASQPVAPGGGASQPARSRKSAETLMEAIRKFGRPPKRNGTASKKEQKLAVGLIHAKRGGHLSDEHKAELAAMKEKEQEVQAENNGKKPLMVVIGEFGKLPKRIRTASKKEQKLVMRVCNAKRAGKLSAGEEAELAARGEKDSELAAMSGNDCAMRDVRDF